VWGKQGVLHRGLIIKRVKPMVSSSQLDEALCAVASHIMDSNGCSGVRCFDRSFQGEYQWVCGERRVLLRGLVMWPVKARMSSLVSVEDTGSAVSDIKLSNQCSGQWLILMVDSNYL
jgi:hypothetical protein